MKFRYLFQCLSTIFIAVFFSFSNKCLAGEQIKVGNFSGQSQNIILPDYWETLLFAGIDRHTVYSLVFDEGIGTIQAVSRGSSSALIRKITINPTRYSTVSFRWKIQDIVESADLTIKKGDDASARVYVSFAYDSTQVSWWEAVKAEAIRLYYGEYPPIASLAYVWASHEKHGQIIESPYTSRVKVIVLEAGAEKKGQWVSEQRNIRADYRAAFGSGDIPMISGVALMTDTDNTGGRAVAWYGDIVFSETLAGTSE